jgi:2-hydroxychromene-2-carboxylate isomerase
MVRQIEFFFDYGSPFSYLAHIQLPGFAKRNGATVVYRPILLGAVLKATGNSSPMTVPAKARYMAKELKRWAARYNVQFALNPHPFLGNTLALMRGAVAARHLGSFPAYNDVIYRAIWADGLDLGNVGVLAGVTRRAGLDAAEIAAPVRTSRDQRRAAAQYRRGGCTRSVWRADHFRRQRNVLGQRSLRLRRGGSA